MDKVLFLDMESLFAALFWGNAASFLFLCLYYRNSVKKGPANERRIVSCLIAARLLHAAYYFVASGRDILPDWLSVNVGNTALFIGFFFEAHAIFKIIKGDGKLTDRLLLAMLAVSIIAFNLIEYLMPTSGLRITVASICVVAIMAFPCVRMLCSRDSSGFTKSTALLYCVFLLLLLPRAWYCLHNQDVGILTTNAVQSLTFLSLLLQLILGLPAYIMIIKEYTDDALVLMATTDKLTGATNRHAFQDAAAAMVENCKRYRGPLSLLFIDIDHFKQVNDQYGHAFGDAVLAMLASIIDRCLRGSDLSCRYGGEEFVVLLSGSDFAAAQAVAGRIMDQVRQAGFEEHPDFQFTISVGVASGVPAQHHQLEDIITAADKAMYKAKHQGRNRVVAAGFAEGIGGTV